MDKERFGQIRNQLGMTQTQLAAVLGVTQTTVSRWESGAKPIGNPQILEYALLYLLQQRQAELRRAMRAKPKEVGDESP